MSTVRVAEQHARTSAPENNPINRSTLSPLPPSLYQVNSNPCLEFVCPLLQEMIVRVIDDTLSVALDPIFPPPEKHKLPTMDGTACNAGAETGSGGFTRVYPVVQ